MTTMHFGRSIALVFALLVNALTLDSAQAQPAPVPGAPSALDDAARRTVVESAAQALRSRYVFPDVGERAAAAIESALAAGKYADLEQPWLFAERLTADLQAVARDKHLRVSAPGPAPADSDAGAAPTPPPRSEGGVTRADRLAGNIGYLELVAFPPAALFNPAVDRAMASLEDTRALIVDARRNGGGDPISVSHLVSYFLDSKEPVHINDFIWRNPGTETFRTQEFWSTPTPFSYAGKPVYVLTSGRTFSGGEEFAYDMQVMKLGVLVGETTGGGANPGGGAPLGSGLVMFVPGGRARNATTGTNWEGVGVKPDVAAPSPGALKVALERLGLAPTATEIDALSEARLFEPRSTPQPGAEAAVRRMSEENARGEPNYDLLSPEMAQATRTQLESLKTLFTSLGPIKSVTFVNVGPMGADVYDVEYANGSATWTIALTPDGKTAMAGVRRKPAGP
jgi:hypothetical protein